jgi:cytoskeletal protein RodZ
MPVWAWILIAVGAVLVIALIVWQLMTQRRTRKLRGDFGPEYERTVSSADSKRAAEAELAERKDRRSSFDIRPLTVDERARYSGEWREVQAQFVDDPTGAVVRADTLIQAVMVDRGYPMEDFDQRAADVSVDHPRVVENYREGQRLYRKTAAGDGTTEDLRQAMRAYRRLFEELVEEGDAEDVETFEEDRAVRR